MAKSLSMSKPAISDNLEHLINIGIAMETGDGSSSNLGGRKPRIIKFNENYKYIVAVDFNYSEPVFVLADLNGDIVSDFDTKIHKDANSQSCEHILINGINILLEAKKITDDMVGYVAIASPGMFNDRSELTEFNTYNMGHSWAQVEYRKVLKDRFGSNVIVNNDIKAATLGERMYEASEKPKNMIFFSCGVGFGSGIIINSSLYFGDNSSAGKIYNYRETRLSEDETLEKKICISGLVNTINEGIREGKSSILKDVEEEITFNHIVSAYEAGDEYIVSVIRGICEKIAVVIFNMSAFLDVRKVVFGGEYSVFFDLLQDIYVKEFSSKYERTATLECSKLGRLSGIYGLIHVARSKIFDDVTGKRTTAL